MVDQFDVVFFVAGGFLFFVLPLIAILGTINFVISKKMAKNGQQKSNYYWFKLIGISMLVLILGLFIYDAYYKINA